MTENHRESSVVADATQEPQGLAQNRDEMICAALRSGERADDVAKKWGLTGTRIRQIARAGGVALPKFRELQHRESLDGEIWRGVEGWPYEVSNMGRVRRTRLYFNSKDSGEVRLTICSGGYLGFSLALNRKKKTALVHDVAAKAFLGPRPSPLHVVAHWDGNPLNNRIENLRWATYEENELDKKRHDRHLPGERNHNAKCTEADVRAIRWSREPLSVLAASFGISKATASKIRRGDAWKHVD